MKVEIIQNTILLLELTIVQQNMNVKTTKKRHFPKRYGNY